MPTPSKRKPKATAAKGGSTTIAKNDKPEALTQVDTSGVPEAVIATPSIVETLSPVTVSNELRKKELLDLVVERSGLKKKDIKPVVEAMLAVLGDALSQQREMNLQPLGKLKIQRGKELPDGRALVLKLRQKSAHLNAPVSAAIDPD